MRSEFEKWFKTSRSYLILKDANYYDLDLFEFNESYQRYVHSGVQIAFETWQHQQTKVDELQNNINLLNEALDIKEQLNQKLREHEDELQKMVDAASNLVESWNMTNFDRSTHFNDGYEEGCFNCARELEQALKGGEDANQ